MDAKPRHSTASPRTGTGLSAKSVLAAPRLARDFFNRDAIVVARELLGKLLVRRDGRKLLAGRIVEGEAYLAPIPPLTLQRTHPRNAVLFGPPSHASQLHLTGITSARM
jgi:DNA-3-methyladenine glycosylase